MRYVLLVLCLLPVALTGCSNHKHLLHDGPIVFQHLSCPKGSNDDDIQCVCRNPILAIDGQTGNDVIVCQKKEVKGGTDIKP